jgi:hypothetical protein
MPRINPTTTSIGPAQRMMASLYRTTVQKVATSKKLCQGSPVVHVRRPTSLFRGRRNGCEYARALVMAGGVATSKGDLRCTITLERCREVKAEPAIVEGEKAAIVGGWEESAWPPCGCDAGAMDIHGRSSVGA